MAFNDLAHVGQLLSPSPGSKHCHAATHPVLIAAPPSRAALSPGEVRRPRRECRSLAFSPDGLVQGLGKGLGHQERERQRDRDGERERERQKDKESERQRERTLGAKAGERGSW